jgi:hypothetical protein
LEKRANITNKMTETKKTDKLYQKFNTRLGKLLTLVSSECDDEDDADILAIRDDVMTFIRSDPTNDKPLKDVGSSLWKNKKYIVEDDDGVVTVDISGIKSTKPEDTSEEYGDVIRRLYEIIDASPDSVITKSARYVKDLLDYYILYLMEQLPKKKSKK